MTILPMLSVIQNRDAAWADYFMSWFMVFAVRFELSRGIVGETVEFEEIAIGGPDEKVVVYR